MEGSSPPQDPGPDANQAEQLTYMRLHIRRLEADLAAREAQAVPTPPVQSSKPYFIRQVEEKASLFTGESYAE